MLFQRHVFSMPGFEGRKINMEKNIRKWFLGMRGPYRDPPYTLVFSDTPLYPLFLQIGHYVLYHDSPEILGLAQRRYRLLGRQAGGPCAQGGEVFSALIVDGGEHAGGTG